MKTGAFYTAALVVIFGPLLAAPRAQQHQPIYPAYDGFIKNADGSFTLSFAYFSHNADVVTVPPGAANTFTPEPGDRMQPTVFKPGHWRFQCVMVVGPELADKMRWSLSYAGTTTGTSERMLQSNWNLVEGAAELAKIDYAKVPRGVCLNRAPQVRVLGVTPRRGQIPTLMAVVGDEFNLFGSAHDEGLPRGKAFTVGWKVLKGPGDVTFSHPDAARTKLSFTTPGTYELELTASDSDLTSRTRVTIVVAPQP
jgi:hypothetical protein